jgi:4-hydroxythreonine-4-phosphate dehydrogenase (EC 1.1.1.262)
MGDAAGIGPEIIVKAFASGLAPDCVVVGDIQVIAEAAARLNSAEVFGPSVARIARYEQWKAVPMGVIPVVQAHGLVPGSLRELPLGQVDARAGAAAHAAIVTAAQAAMQGEVSAVVTAPIHKEAMHAAGIPYPGHTELLQHLAGGVAVRMMLANDALRTVLVTIHLSVRDALDAVTFDAVLNTVRITHAAAQRWGQPKPRIAVAGLNPHAGEGGYSGTKNSASSRRLSGRRRPKALMRAGLMRPTPFSCVPVTHRSIRASSTWWSPCCMTTA